MNILYIGYWNLNDPLTVSTIFPHLSILREFSQVNRILFVNIEREKIRPLPAVLQSLKIEYYPYLSENTHGFWWEKISDFIEAPRFIEKQVVKYNVDLIISRGAPAGGLAWLVFRRTKTPFLVESFEPHAQYMLESGVWKWYDPRYLFQVFLEKKQKQKSKGLMPVAHNYRNVLIEEKVQSNKIITVPCAVDQSQFAFSEEERKSVRKLLSIPRDSIVGIYVGRFSGLYLEDEAFCLYRGAFDFFKEKFYLILLCPDIYHPWVNAKIEEFKLPGQKIFVKSVAHDQVPGYLSASDFSFASYKSSKSMAYLSPVKIAEYWANGLSVLLTKGIGDENDILLKYPFAGVLFDPKRIEGLMHDYFREVSDKLLTRCKPENEIPKLVSTHRNVNCVREAYAYYLKEMER